MADARAPLTFEVPTTTADNAAFLRRVWRAPNRVLIQAAVFAAVALGLMVLQAITGIVAALFSHRPLAALATYLHTSLRSDITSAAPWIALFCFVAFLLNLVVLVPRQCQIYAARIMSGYPESKDQPTPTIVNTIRLDARGVESVTRHEHLFCAWPLIERLVETRHHLFLMTSGSTALVIPKAALDVASTERVRDHIVTFLSAEKAPTT